MSLLRPALALALFLAFVNVGCSAATKAAARDPQKCERDPDCVRKQGKSNDCATACSDNYDCMDRCQQVQHGTSP